VTKQFRRRGRASRGRPRGGPAAAAARPGQKILHSESRVTSHKPHFQIMAHFKFEAARSEFMVTSSAVQWLPVTASDSEAAAAGTPGLAPWLSQRPSRVINWSGGLRESESERLGLELRARAARARRRPGTSRSRYSGLEHRLILSHGPRPSRTRDVGFSPGQPEALSGCGPGVAHRPGRPSHRVPGVLVTGTVRVTVPGPAGARPGRRSVQRPGKKCRNRRRSTWRTSTPGRAIWKVASWYIPPQKWYIPP
jgi:hypothetical protein